MGDIEKSGEEVRKLSKLEREREKVRIAQENISRLLAKQKKKQSELETRQKVLLGIMLQKMIADGVISAETFTKYSQTMTDRDQKVVKEYWNSLKQEKSED